VIADVASCKLVDFVKGLTSQVTVIWTKKLPLRKNGYLFLSLTSLSINTTQCAEYIVYIQKIQWYTFKSSTQIVHLCPKPHALYLPVMETANSEVLHLLLWFKWYLHSK